MVRRVTPAQLQSLIRQQEAARRRAISKYNSAVDDYNRDVKRAVDNTNRENKRRVDNYNREVRAHNNRVRANRSRLQAEINRLSQPSQSSRHAQARTSTVSLHSIYQRVEVDAEAGPWTDREQHLVDLAEAETANSAQMTNALLGQPLEDDAGDVEATALTDELSSVSPDLHNRWQGALFSLNPRNPDAARHFCTSSREVVIRMIDLNAPDSDVLAAVPGCETKNGQPSRRAKIRFLLDRAGSTERDSLEDFVEADIDDVLNLFSVFNSGTHGSAGKMDIPTLRGLKVRVEGAVRFLSAITRAAGVASS